MAKMLGDCNMWGKNIFIHHISVRDVVRNNLIINKIFMAHDKNYYVGKRQEVVGFNWHADNPETSGLNFQV